MKKYWEKFTDHFGNTILHPQFIMLSYTKEGITEAQKYSKNKKLVDLGCGRMPYRKNLEPITKSYTGVDDPKVSKLYNGQKPEILADITKKIPVKNNFFDVALLLEVLEYLENPLNAFKEIHRILKPKGVLIITTPFLYPIHDTPYDRNRFTDTQLRYLLEKSGFKITKLKSQGGFFDFWIQSLNVYIFKNIMSQPKFAALVLIPISLCITTFTNLITLFIPKLSNDFPLNYLVVAVKSK